MFPPHKLDFTVLLQCLTSGILLSSFIRATQPTSSSANGSLLVCPSAIINTFVANLRRKKQFPWIKIPVTLNLSIYLCLKCILLHTHSTIEIQVSTGLQERLQEICPLLCHKGHWLHYLRPPRSGCPPRVLWRCFTAVKDEKYFIMGIIWTIKIYMATNEDSCCKDYIIKRQ